MAELQHQALPTVRHLIAWSPVGRSPAAAGPLGGSPAAAPL